MKNGFTVTTDLNDMDFHVIHQFISHSYWAKGMPEQTLRKALANSLCFGVLNENGEQVGFARMITDGATFAYLADVFILEAYRGKGLSKWLVANIMDHAELQGLRRIMLATRDAHGLYRQFGFNDVSQEEASMLMQIRDPDVYLR